MGHDHSDNVALDQSGTVAALHVDGNGFRTRGPVEIQWKLGKQTARKSTAADTRHDMGAAGGASGGRGNSEQFCTCLSALDSAESSRPVVCQSAALARQCPGALLAAVTMMATRCCLLAPNAVVSESSLAVVETAHGLRES